MSNRRSCTLFIALIIILGFLYYESLKQKNAQLKDNLSTESPPLDQIQDGPRVRIGRRLLSYSEENTAETSSVEEVSSEFHKFRALTLRDLKGNFKRIKRSTRNRKGFYKWKFNVSVSRLDNESTKPSDDLKDSLEESKNVEESLNVEIYVDGENKQFKTLEHSWNAVKDSLANFYSEPKERDNSALFNLEDFSTQTIQVNGVKNLHLTSTEDPLIVQKGFETNKTARGREGKLLFLNFGGGGNKENPPLEPQVGENVVSQGTSEPMEDISFVNSTEQFDIIKVPEGVFSSTLLPEHKELDLPVAEPILSLTTRSESKLGSEVKVAKLSTPNPTPSNEILNCDDCVKQQDTRTSNKLETVADSKTDPTNKDILQAITPKVITDLSPSSIDMFCLNFVQSLRKSPRFAEGLNDVGSGQSEIDVMKENLKVTDIGSVNLDADENVESFRAPTQAATTIKTPQQQIGLLHRLWSRVPNFIRRNQRSVDEDLDISGFPPNFSVKDCKDLFTDQIKSDFTTPQTSLEETILTESKTTLLSFSPDSLRNETENSSESNLDFIRKTDGLNGDRITAGVTDNLLVEEFKNLPLTTEQTLNIIQNVPSFSNQIMDIDESNTISAIPFKQMEAISADKVPFTESLLKNENVEQPNVPSVSDLVATTATAIPSKKSLTDLNAESVLSLNLQDQNPVSSSTLEVEIFPSEHAIEENKRFFSDFNNEEILELGSSDERIISDNVTETGELKVVTIDQRTPKSQERVFLPSFNLFNEGSGARELPELHISNISRIKNKFDFLETNDQSDNILIEEALREETIVNTSLTDQEPRFIANFFSEGSGAREILKLPTDININKNEFSMSNTNDQSVPESSFTEDILKETTVDPLTDQERRFIPNFFSGGSGAREISESYISTDINMNKDEFDSSDTNKFASLEAFDVGNGERKHDRIEFSTETKDFIIDFRVYNVSLTEFEVSSASEDLISEEIIVNILQKTKTDAPELSAHHEAFTDEYGGSEFPARNQGISDGGFDFRSSGDGRDISEISFNDTVFTSEQLCTNCTKDLNLPDECDACNYIEGRESSDISYTNGTAFVSTSSNLTSSALCSGCEKFNDKVPIISEESSLTTQMPCLNCSNFPQEIPLNHQIDDTQILPSKESVAENKPPSKEDILTPSATYFQDSASVNSTVPTNSNKNDPRFVHLLGSEEDMIENGPIHFEPEPEFSTPHSKLILPSRGARFNDIPEFSSQLESTETSSSVSIELVSSEVHTNNNGEVHFKPESELLSKPSLPRRGARLDVVSEDSFDFSSIPETANGIFPNSSVNEAVDFLKRIQYVSNSNDVGHSESVTGISVQSKPSQRGARFNDFSPDEPIITSTRKTIIPEIHLPLQPTQSVNLFQSRRGARGHDLFDLEEFDSTATNSASEGQTELNNLDYRNETNTLPETKTESALNTDVDRNSVTHSFDRSEISNTFSFETSRTKSTPSNSIVLDHSSVTTSIEKMYIADVNLNPELKLPSLKFCHSASECNVTLNERCMPNDDVLICDCGKAFRRNLETKKCEATITLQTTISLPGERFYEDLRNSDTELYQQKKRDYIKIMWYLLKHDPKLFHTVAEVDIASFEEGSLIVKYTMKLLNNGNETASELVELLAEDLNKIISDQQLMKNISLEFQNASVSSFVLNPCLSSDTNYCHKNALCIPTEEKGFKCQCKADYLDNSRDKRYPGENCTGYCASNFCGGNGECYINENGEKQCICSGWYFGEKCELSGLVIIAGFAFANVLVIVLVVLFVFFCKKKKNRKLYNRNLTNFQPGQNRSSHPVTRDAIALDEVVHSRNSKFVAISTPMYEVANPVIQVTSPSFTGSSIDYDSTFDRSPYDSETSRYERAV